MVLPLLCIDKSKCIKVMPEKEAICRDGIFIPCSSSPRLFRDKAAE